MSALLALLGSGNVHFMQVETSGGLNSIEFDHIPVITFMTLSQGKSEHKLSKSAAYLHHPCLSVSMLYRIFQEDFAARGCNFRSHNPSASPAPPPSVLLLASGKLTFTWRAAQWENVSWRSFVRIDTWGCPAFYCWSRVHKVLLCSGHGPLRISECRWDVFEMCLKHNGF